jgi:alpha-mannosidase
LVQEGYQLNVAAQVIEGQAGSQSLFTLDQSNIILETVKPAEDGTAKDMVLRLYESLGTRTRVKLSTSLPIITCLPEPICLRRIQKTVDISDGSLNLEFRPFEILTLRLTV